MTAHPLSPEPAVDDRFVETLLNGTATPVGAAAVEFGAVARALQDLRAWGSGPAPVPSPALAALFDPVIVPLYPQVQRRTHKGAWLSAAAAAVVIGTGVAAAQQALPEGMQRLVSTVINDATPFHVPSTSHSTDHRNGPDPVLPTQAAFGQSHGPTSVPAGGPDGNGSTNGRKVGPPASNGANRSGGVGTSSPPVPGQTRNGPPVTASTGAGPTASQTPGPQPSETKPTAHPSNSNTHGAGGGHSTPPPPTSGSTGHGSGTGTSGSGTSGSHS